MRFSVMLMPSMIASYLPAFRPGMMPSQSCETHSHCISSREQRLLPRSISKPISLPSDACPLYGMYAPSVAITTFFQSLAIAAGAVSVTAAANATSRRTIRTINLLDLVAHCGA